MGGPNASSGVGGPGGPGVPDSGYHPGSNTTPSYGAGGVDYGAVHAQPIPDLNQWQAEQAKNKADGKPSLTTSDLLDTVLVDKGSPQLQAYRNAMHEVHLSEGRAAYIQAAAAAKAGGTLPEFLKNYPDATSYATAYAKTADTNSDLEILQSLGTAQAGNFHNDGQNGVRVDNVNLIATSDKPNATLLEPGHGAQLPSLNQIALAGGTDAGSGGKYLSATQMVDGYYANSPNYQGSDLQIHRDQLRSTDPAALEAFDKKSLIALVSARDAASLPGADAATQNNAQNIPGSTNDQEAEDYLRSHGFPVTDLMIIAYYMGKGNDQDQKQLLDFVKNELAPAIQDQKDAQNTAAQNQQGGDPSNSGDAGAASSVTQTKLALFQGMGATVQANTQTRMGGLASAAKSWETASERIG